MDAPLVDGVVVVVDVDEVLDEVEVSDVADGTVEVTVVVDGAASCVEGPVPVLPPVKTTTMASSAASANSEIVPSSSAICVRPNLGLRGGDDGGAGREPVGFGTGDRRGACCGPRRPPCPARLPMRTGDRDSWQDPSRRWRRTRDSRPCASHWAVAAERT